MLLLGIESSCDETAAAVLLDGNKLLADVVNSQVSVHEIYGGVVPELASRKHIENIYPVIQEALKQAQVTLSQIDGIAVTRGPGLIGSLLVGYSFAKSLSLVNKIPYVGVDHMAGHLLSVFLADEKPSFPYIALIASGGHSSIFYVEDYTTYRLLGRTRDDAAGEAFDKVAKLLDLGYPGGPIISKVAEKGVANAIEFPRAWLEKDSYDFSFSGVKTAVANFVRNQNNDALPVADICASFQEAAVEVLVEKTFQAALAANAANVVVAGGVAANPRLREAFTERGAKDKVNVYMPPRHFCTDNAAMIALAGFHYFEKEATLSPDTDVYSRSQFIPFQ